MRPYRRERVASAVRTVVSEAIAHKLHDPRVEPLTTVTRVDVSADLQIAKLYLIVPGDEAAERRTMAAIQHASGFLQRMVASQLQLRQCPELRFMVDEGAKIARQTMKLLEDNRRNHPERFEAPKDGEEGLVDRADRSAESEVAPKGNEHDGNTSPRLSEGTGE